MRLNPDCIRDILYTIEEMSSYSSMLNSQQLANADLLKKYTDEELLYHLQQLNWSGYIVVPNKNKTLDGLFFITDLSPIGHEFIANIREDTTWNKTKEIAKKVGSFSLDTLKDISTNVISELIKSKF